MTLYRTLRTATAPLLQEEGILEDRKKRGEANAVKEMHTYA
jgi:hypothetical protein